MLTTLKPLPFLALLALATPTLAQEATADETAPAAEATPEAAPGTAAPAEGAEAPAPGGDLSMGEPATGGEPQPGQPYIRETFGDWSLRCLKAAEGPDPCQLYQLLKDQNGNNVAEISMFPLPAGREAVAGATIVTPLETLLTENLTLSVDGGAARRYPFTFCNAGGCVARVGFTAEEVEQFKRGNAAELSVVPAAAPDEHVTLTISLSGFTAGYEAAEPQAAPAE